MRILDIALKDLSQVFRDKRSLLFLAAMPIVFTLFMGFAYSSGGDGDAPADNRITLGWADNDPGGRVTQELFARLSNSESVKLVEIDPQAAEDAVRQGEVAGVLVVPAGYSAQVTGGGAAQLTLIADTTTPQGQSLFQLLRAPITQLMSAAEIARLSAETVGSPDEFQPSFSAAAQAWSETDSAALVKVEMAVAEPEQDWYGDNPYNQASPGIIVQFAIFGLVTSGQILMEERKSRTLQRMMTTSLHPWQVVAGHALAMFAIVFGQVLLLVVFGQLALGVDYGRAWGGVLLVSVALGVWIAAMGLFISVLAKDDSQVVLFSMVAMFIFSALGGAWFPLEGTGGAFAALGRLLPSAWAMTGYQNILMRGLGSASALLPAAAMLAYALGFFVLAIWRLRKTEM